MFRKIFFILINCLFAEIAMSQINIKVTDIPENTPAGAKIFVAGNFNNWNPADTNFILKQKDNFYYIDLKTNIDEIEFKFTLGSWQTVESDKKGNEISNRKIKVITDDIVELKIEGWKSVSEKISTRSKNVHIVSDSFYMPQFDRYRRIWIYLPPDYHESEKKYPVLYMHDGQNLFDASTSFSGEWNVDETLNTLFETDSFSLIVVGIDNGGDYRVGELTPWKNDKYGGGDGKKYADFIVETLKPFIDENYRTLSDRENTGVMGSSLGGLISYYMAFEYNNIFSKIGVFSPSFWFSTEVYTFSENSNPEFNFNMYILGGGKENAFTYQEINKIDKILKTKDKANITVKKVANGKHHETFWSKQFKNAIVNLWNLNDD